MQHIYRNTTKVSPVIYNKTVLRSSGKKKKQTKKNHKSTEPKKVAKIVRHHRNFSGALQQNKTTKTGNVNYETCPPWL